MEKVSNTEVYEKGSIKAIDLFCGAGGLTKGLEMAGIQVTMGIDSDPSCKFPYEANNRARFLQKSVELVTSSEISSALQGAKVRILAGCAPCQTFSTYNQKAKCSDSRWWLLNHFSRLVEEISPEIVSMENVPGLAKQKVFDDFISKLRNLGYYVQYETVNCVDFSVPQQRYRLVLLASKLGEISLIRNLKKKKKLTVREAIGNLPHIEAGQIDKKDPLHQSAVLTGINLKRMHASKPGGTWRDWPQDLVSNCHKKESGKTYPSVYGRMSWEEPSPTITTQFFGFGNGRFGHPEQNRAISLREGAILQSFPRDYKFVKAGQEIFRKVVGRQIGNAVPVELAKAIGESIKKHLDNFPNLYE